MSPAGCNLTHLILLKLTHVSEYLLASNPGLFKPDSQFLTLLIEELIIHRPLHPARIEED